MSGHGRTSCVVVALLLAACAGQTRYHHFVPLPRQGWGRQDTVRFHLPGGTSWAGLQASVEVRATRSFPYSDLWLALEQRDSTARVLHTDTLHMSMADSQGNLLGHGFELLEYRSTAVPLLSDSLGACARVYVRHLMSCEDVPALTDIGLRVSCR